MGRRMPLVGLIPQRIAFAIETMMRLGFHFVKVRLIPQRIAFAIETLDSTAID